MRLIMQHLRPWCREAVIGANSVQACVVGKPLGVIGEADEVVREVEVSVDQAHLAFPVAAESSFRDDTEETVSPVAVLYRVTSALCLEVVNIVYVEWGTDVNSGVCVGNRHTIDKPGNLMASVDVQDVVSQVR